MSGLHAAPRRRGKAAPWKLVLAGVLTPAALIVVMALGAAAGVLCGAFLAVLYLAGGIIRVPVRAWLWAGVMLSWPAVLAADDAGLLDGREPYMAGTTGTCLFATGLLIQRSLERQRLQRQWRESGGRMDSQPRVSTEIQVTANAARLDEHSGEIHGLEALRDEVRAMQAAVAAAFAAAGTPAPPSASPAPERHLHVVGDDDTRPFGRIA